MSSHKSMDSNLQSDLYHLTATEIAPLIKNGTITVEQYISNLSSRIQERDEHVQAWAFLDLEGALRQARILDQIPQDRRGPLHGIPIAVKDVVNTKGPIG